MTFSRLQNYYDSQHIVDLVESCSCFMYTRDYYEETNYSEFSWWEHYGSRSFHDQTLTTVSILATGEFFNRQCLSHLYNVRSITFCHNANDCIAKHDAPFPHCTSQNFFQN